MKRTLTEISGPLLKEMSSLINDMNDGKLMTKKLSAKYGTLRAEFFFSLASYIINEGIPIEKFVRGYLYEDDYGRQTIGVKIVLR